MKLVEKVVSAAIPILEMAVQRFFNKLLEPQHGHHPEKSKI
jgi:hypothetical protein